MKIVSGEDLEIAKIFDPEGTRKKVDLLFSGRRLIHYTSADTALKILKNREVWLRNVRCMNDFMEVEHGLEMMIRFFATPGPQNPDIGVTELFSALDYIVPEISKKTIETMNAWLPRVRNDSYIMCLSEHHKKEDDNGRLSMWRAYGAGSVAVGIVINPLPFYSISDALGSYSAPVSYQTPEEYFNTLRSVANNVRNNAEALKKISPDELAGHFF